MKKNKSMKHLKYFKESIESKSTITNTCADWWNSMKPAERLEFLYSKRLEPSYSKSRWDKISQYTQEDICKYKFNMDHKFQEGDKIIIDISKIEKEPYANEPEVSVKDSKKEGCASGNLIPGLVRRVKAGEIATVTKVLDYNTPDVSLHIVFDDGYECGIVTTDVLKKVK